MYSTLSEKMQSANEIFPRGARIRNSILLTELKIENYSIGSEIMLEYDEYKLKLQGLEKNITDLRDSL